MSINFSGSFEKKSSGFLSHIGKKKMMDGVRVISSAKKQKQAMKVIEKMEADFVFLNDDVKKSKKLTDKMFTNFLHETTRADIKSGIQSIFNDQSIVDTLKGDYVRLNPKILDCIKLYYPQANHSLQIFKSNMQDAAGIPKLVRVFTIADIDVIQHKACFKIVLIDPFHLIIPSDIYDRGVRVQSSEQAEKATFQQNQNNEICMSAYVESQLQH